MDLKGALHGLYGAGTLGAIAKGRGQKAEGKRQRAKGKRLTGLVLVFGESPNHLSHCYICLRLECDLF